MRHANVTVGRDIVNSVVYNVAGNLEIRLNLNARVGEYHDEGETRELIRLVAPHQREFDGLAEAYANLDDVDVAKGALLFSPDRGLTMP